MSEVRFMEDKPKDCRYCYFWSGKKKGCGLGGEANCYYRIHTKEGPLNECDGCPYRQEPKCVGLCMKKILKDWKEKR